MNLKFHLVTRIILIALLCLLVVAGYSLYRTNQQVGQEAWATTKNIGKQLEFQLLRMNSGLGQTNEFPDFDLWQQTRLAPVFVSALKRKRTVKVKQTRLGHFNEVIYETET